MGKGLVQFDNEVKLRLALYLFGPLGHHLAPGLGIERGVDLDSVEATGQNLQGVKTRRLAFGIDAAFPIRIGPACGADAYHFSNSRPMVRAASCSTSIKASRIAGVLLRTC